jgi:hypothetical protein
MSWLPASDNVAVTSYRVFANGVFAGSSTTPTFTIGGLTCGTQYAFGVSAVDAAGNVSATSSISAATAACNAPPAAPSVSIAWGDQHTTATCTVVYCTYIVVTLHDFPAGTHTINCNADWPPPPGFYRSYDTSDATSEYCVFGYPGHNVWVIVDGVQSNTITKSY